MANILVYALHYDGAINKNSLGAVSEGAKLAAELGGEAHAILLGENVPQELAASLGKYGARRCWSLRAPRGSRSRSSTRWRKRSPTADTHTLCSAEAFSASRSAPASRLASVPAWRWRSQRAGGGRRADRRAPDPRRLGDLGDPLPLAGRDHHRPPERVRDQGRPAVPTPRSSSSASS